MLFPMPSQQCQSTEGNSNGPDSVPRQGTYIVQISETTMEHFSTEKNLNKLIKVTTPTWALLVPEHNL